MNRTGIFPRTARDDLLAFTMTSAVCSYQVLDVQIVASLVQTYVSNSTRDQEAIYIFPLPPDAAVCDFKAVIDGKKVINGIVKEKDEAKAEYTAAVAAGKTAGLLEQQHADIFQVSLGNLKPKQTIDVHISYVAIIAHDGSAPESLRLMIPVTIAPRYGGPAPSGLSSAVSVKSRLQITIAVQMTANISSITSPTHPVSLTLGSNSATPAENHDPARAFVSLESNDFLEKDVVVVMSAQKIDRPRCSVERDEEGSTDAYSLTLVPRFELPALPRQNYIFLVDRSGSMGGFRINAVRAALQIMLRSLPTKDTSFNVWSFGSRHSSLWQASKVYSATSVKEATTHIDTIDANYGGTEIDSALKAVYDSTKSKDAAADKIPTSVFVLTDGEAWNLDGVLQTVWSATLAAKTDKNLLRTFVLGVGDDVSTPMCEGMARAGKGIAVFVGNNEKPDAKLMGLLKAARSAVIEDLAVDWGVSEEVASEEDDDFEVIDKPKSAAPAPAVVAPISLFDESPKPVETPVTLGPGKVVVNLDPPPRIQQAPELDKLPIPLYPGFRTSIFAIIKRDRGVDRPASVKITGNVLGIPVVLEVPVAPSSVTELVGKNHGILHVLAARALIRGLEDQPTSDENNAKVVRLGTRYSLASSQTSFVAIDDDGEVKDSPPSLVVQEEGAAGRERERVRVLTQARRMAKLGASRPVPQITPQSASQYAPRYAPQSIPPPGSSSFKSNLTSVYASADAFAQPHAAMSFTASSAVPDADEEAELRPASKTAFKRVAAPPPPPARKPLAAPARYLSAGGNDIPPIAPKPSSPLISPVGAFGSAAPAPISPRSRPQPRLSSTSSVNTSARKASSTSPTASATPPAPTVESLAREQDFQGFFPNSALQGILPMGILPKPASLESVSASEEEKNNIWSSLLVLAYLEKAFASEKASWDFLAEKALDYIKSVIPEDARASINEWKGKAVTSF